MIDFERIVSLFDTLTTEEMLKDYIEELALQVCTYLILLTVNHIYIYLFIYSFIYTTASDLFIPYIVRDSFMLSVRFRYVSCFFGRKC